MNGYQDRKGASLISSTSKRAVVKVMVGIRVDQSIGRRGGEKESKRIAEKRMEGASFFAFCIARSPPSFCP